MNKNRYIYTYNTTKIKMGTGVCFVFVFGEGGAAEWVTKKTFWIQTYICTHTYASSQHTSHIHTAVVTSLWGAPTSNRSDTERGGGGLCPGSRADVVVRVVVWFGPRHRDERDMRCPRDSVLHGELHPQSTTHSTGEVVCIYFTIHSLRIWKALKCKPSANCACTTVLLIDGLGPISMRLLVISS